ncbi:FMN-dependent NADH-azoreductase [Kribbella kalugense]|uniref:FMN dependent NADH:quinone oxidoreductase n=1 Tax=Kribbella kalugense TaxID=2512221 RepID=A0A4R7ZY38_9ACTN|nr:NAD(P)H-dependent oxidoreductase [Kribbella kalugense]TDW22715.1 FMN-dependent NADH-azoreductase [Kribbella kalugense]
MLHLDCSANRSAESVTRQLTREFADRWAGPGYRYRDLAADPVPPIDTAYCQLGRRSERLGVVPLVDVDQLIQSEAEAEAWALTRPLIEEVRAASVLLIGAPLYNYALPASLKAWIDRITFPGAFADDVLRDLRVVVVTASGGAYGPGAPREGWDHQEPYLRRYFGNLGVQDLTLVRAELTLTGLVDRLAEFKPLAERSLAEARARITRWHPPVRAQARPEVETHAAS